MGLSIFANRRRTQKGRFIASQRLLYLDAPAEKRKECLEPARFRAGRQRKDRKQSEMGRVELPPGCRWRRVKKGARERFLTRLDRPRLCLLIDAGVGKTTAMQQIQYLRSALLPGHLAMGFRFAELKDDADDYLDTGGRSWLPLRFRDVCNEMPAPDVRTLILRKIRQGRFTLLVDAFDQSRSIRDGGRDPHVMAAALTGFLRRYPQVRCVVSGRPNAIHRYWDDLFAHEEWGFVQIDFFTRKEQGRYVGSTRWKKMQRLEADVIAVPRMLETVLNLSAEELDGVRTGSDLYWRALDDSLKEAFANQDIGIQRQQAEKLFALIAIELHQADNFSGIDSAGFDEFVEGVWLKRSQQRSGDGRRSPVPAYPDCFVLADHIQKLGRVNEVLDFAVLEDSGDQQLFFRDRTQQDFFAALWLSRYATEDDRQWLRQHLHVRGAWAEHLQQEERYEFWKLATSMPASAWQRHKDCTWVSSMSALFLPEAGAERAARSTEMIYRAWWGLLETAGKLERGADEWDMAQATADLQQEVYQATERGPISFAELRGDAKLAADQIMWQFLSEFPAIRFGQVTVAQEPRAQEIAAEFDGQWFPTEIPAGKFLMGDEENQYGHEPPHPGEIKASFRLAKHPVTNELYGLFDPEHAGRFDGFREYSPHARCPAILITWYDAWCAATWLHGRLPDEYKWERACRGKRGTSKRYPWWFGDHEAELKKYAWYAANSEDRTYEVDETRPNGKLAKQPNDFALYHMHGNVWEWTAGWYARNPLQGRDPRFVGASRVLRGGSWNYDAVLCRCARRSRSAPERTGGFTGFRVCRSCVGS